MAGNSFYALRIVPELNDRDKKPKGSEPNGGIPSSFFQQQPPTAGAAVPTPPPTATATAVVAAAATDKVVEPPNPADPDSAFKAIIDTLEPSLRPKAKAILRKLARLALKNEIFIDPSQNMAIIWKNGSLGSPISDLQSAKKKCFLHIYIYIYRQGMYIPYKPSNLCT